MRSLARIHPRNLRHSAIAFQRTTVRLTRRLVDVATGHPTSRSIAADASSGRHAGRRRSALRRHLLLRLTSERTVPLAVALVVLVAGAITLGPSVVRPVGAAQDAPQPVRIAVGGGVPVGASSAELADRLDTEAATPVSQVEAVDDGTLYKPVAVDTSVQSGADLLRYYTVKKADTLALIAKKLKVSISTIWWANHFTSTTTLHVGQVLVVPPVNGLVVTVQATDTLQILAARYGIAAAAILSANQLTDPHLILGQVLILPGAKGPPLPEGPISRSSTPIRAIPHTGGTWAWPVVGGGNYISQYFWSGHPAIDIAAHYGTKLVAPRAGTVVFAGWSDNGGGYQVWISIGDGMYTTECHMSAVGVSVGDVVAKGQEVGKVGMSGDATGPHVHFEVWVGYPWKTTSYRVNPLRFY